MWLNSMLSVGFFDFLLQPKSPVELDQDFGALQLRQVLFQLAPSSNVTRPCSTSCMHAMAVTTFVHDATQ